jgi:hypothetical protein
MLLTRSIEGTTGVVQIPPQVEMLLLQMSRMLTTVSRGFLP